MGVVGCLMVVTQHVLALVVGALILRIKTASKVRTEFAVLRTLLIHLSQTSIVECFRIVRQDLRVVCIREASVPFLGKLYVRLRERCNELVVQIEPVIHTVVPNHWFFCFNHRLYDQSEPHFIDEKFLLCVLWINLAFDDWRVLSALTLHALVCWCFRLFLGRIGCWVERRPAKLLTPDDVQVQVMDRVVGAMGIISIVVYNSVALQIQVVSHPRCCQHEVAKNGCVLLGVLHVYQRLQLQILG